MKHAVIYVPGLGDRQSRGQRAVVWLWRIYGVRSEVVRMRWHTTEPFVSKLSRLLTRIDELERKGFRVSLVGTSAGASAVINAFAVRQDTVRRVVCVCGKLRNPQTISQATYRANPAFKESLDTLPDNLKRLNEKERRRILSIRPLADSSVPPEDTVIPGAASSVIPTRGHAPSIALAITLFSPLILGFIRRNI